MKRTHLATITAALLLPAVALAENDIGFNYLQVDYRYVNITDAVGDDDGNGPGFEASWELWRFLYVVGDFARLEFDDGAVELDSYSAGVGAFRELDDNSTVFAEARYLDSEVDFGDDVPVFEDDGYLLSIGYRAENQSAWEFIGRIDYTNTDVTVGYSVDVTVLYDFTRRVSAFGAFAYSEDDRTGLFGVRAYFGKAR